MVILKKLCGYRDDDGNEIVYSGELVAGVRVTFRGSRNRLVIAPDAKLGNFVFDFDCDNGYIEIGGSDHAPNISGSFRVGQDSKIVIGKNVSSTSGVYISSVEGNTVTIGDDVMFASGNELRGDDGHPIFDVRTGKRINPVRPITVGNHVWVGGRAVLFGGATIGDGAVIGWGSVVKGKIPNNAIAVGAPARTIRKNVAWERPHLSLSKPFYKPDSSTVKKSPYWSLTVEPTRPLSPVNQAVLRLRRRAWHLRHRPLNK
jgi:acetyltransferase-like isoleucine patch superfamily enzyme